MENKIDRLIAENQEILDACREKVLKKKRIRRNEDDPFQCRLCLAIQIPGMSFTSVILPEVVTALQDMYGIRVTATGAWNQFSKICPHCHKQLEQSYKFYCQVISTETYLKNYLATNQIKRQKISNEVDIPTDIDDAELVEYVEDLTHLVGPDSENGVDLTLDDQSHDDTDLDFDFTDDEKEESEENVTKEPKNDPSKEGDESLEHTKMVNILLDSYVNGIESEIDCCLIDKKTLASEGAQVSEQVTLVVKDQLDPVSGEAPEEPIEQDKIKPIKKKIPVVKRSSIHDAEYIVCEKCRIIYHRPKGSVTNNCERCVIRCKNEVKNGSKT